MLAVGERLVQSRVVVQAEVPTEPKDGYFFHKGLTIQKGEGFQHEGDESDRQCKKSNQKHFCHNSVIKNGFTCLFYVLFPKRKGAFARVIGVF